MSVSTPGFWKAMRGTGVVPLIMAQLRHGKGVAEVVKFLLREGGLAPA